MIKKYAEHSGILIKKSKNLLGEYIFKVNDGTKTISVKVGKALFEMYQVNSKITIGYIGRKLINIRLGILFNDEL